MGFKNIFVITKIVQYNLSNVLLDFALKGRTYLKGLVWKQDTATAKENTQGSAKKKKKKSMRQLACSQIGLKNMAQKVINMSKNKYNYLHINKIR